MNTIKLYKIAKTILSSSSCHTYPKHISRLTGISEITIRVYVKNMERLGYINISTNVYRMMIIKPTQKLVERIPLLKEFYECENPD